MYSAGQWTSVLETMLADLAAITVHLSACRTNGHTIIAEGEIFFVLPGLTTLAVEINERHDGVRSEVLV